VLKLTAYLIPCDTLPVCMIAGRRARAQSKLTAAAAILSTHGRHIVIRFRRVTLPLNSHFEARTPISPGTGNAGLGLLPLRLQKHAVVIAQYILVTSAVQYLGLIPLETPCLRCANMARFALVGASGQDRLRHHSTWGFPRLTCCIIVGSLLFRSHDLATD
jgi:hypothetical protein